MNKSLKFLNPLLFLLALIQVISVALLVTMPSHKILAVHKLNGFLLIAVVVVHFCLNWQWVKSTYLTRGK